MDKIILFISFTIVRRISSAEVILREVCAKLDFRRWTPTFRPEQGTC